MSEKRNTAQQQIILDALKKFSTHPTVEEVYAEVNKNHPKISMTTVYRNLRKLAESGEIRQVSLPDETERYDRRTERHYHFKCRECGKIFDVDIGYLDGINETVQKKYGFQIDEHDVIFKGICQQCKKDCK
ncbi:MAG: transcriptional repressor [Oscillospiraceae bacterium]|nr:transcriptional repressor [Oscillospiraceae bacterium]